MKNVNAENSIKGMLEQQSELMIEKLIKAVENDRDNEVKTLTDSLFELVNAQGYLSKHQDITIFISLQNDVNNLIRLASRKSMKTLEEDDYKSNRNWVIISKKLFSISSRCQDYISYHERLKNLSQNKK